MSPFEHDAVLYARLERYVLDGVAAGEHVVVIATSEHRQQLRDRLVDLGKEDAVLGLDAEECLRRLLVDGLPDAQRFALLTTGLLRSRGEAVAVACGEMMTVLRCHGQAGAERHLDALWRQVRLPDAGAEGCNPPPGRRLAA
jgi:hypothetical protein